MGKNNKAPKIGENKLTKKLYKAKTKWVIASGIFGAVTMGTAFGTSAVHTHAAENTVNPPVEGADAPTEVTEVRQGKSVTLKNDAKQQTVTSVSDSTNHTQTDKSESAQTTATPTNNVAPTSATSTPVDEEKVVSVPETPATAPAVTAESGQTETQPAVDSQVTTSVSGSPKSGPAPVSSTVVAPEITVLGADASKWFDSEENAGPFENGVVKLTPNEEHKKGVTFLANRIDMAQDFELKGKINAGKDDGGDGLSVGLHSGNLGWGEDGGAVGIGGLPNTFGFKVDSYPNVSLARGIQYGIHYDDKLGSRAYTEDPMTDSFAGFVYADSANGNKATTFQDTNNPGDSSNPKTVTLDNNPKDFAMNYSAANKTLKVDYDGQTWSKNITSWLNGEQYWNLYMSASTGGSTNEHQFQLESLKYTPEYAVSVDYYDKDNVQPLANSDGSAVSAQVKYEIGADKKSFNYTVETPTITGYVFSGASQNASLTGVLNETNKTVHVTLEYQVDPTKARDDANQALLATTPVSHEADVAKARTDLVTELANTGAAAAAIVQATNTLKGFTTTAKDSRNVATADATTTLTNAARQNAKPEVAPAIQTLNDVMDKAAHDDEHALTTNIEAATQNLKDKLLVADADDAQDLRVAKTGAKQALDATKPVSYEDKVEKARTAVETEMNNGGATATNLKQLTDTLTHETTDAKAARGKVNGAATTELSNAAGQSTKPEVATAIQNLNDVVAKAGTDVKEALTTDIETATGNLRGKVKEAVLKDLADAKANAGKALQATKPVSYEGDVAQARTAVETELNNGGATAITLAQVTKALTDKTAEAKGARDGANAEGHKALTIAVSESTDPEVDGAFTKLSNVMHLAETDVKEALTTDVKKATNDLNLAFAKAAAKHLDELKTDAKQALQATAPVSHETDVETARTAVESELKNANATIISVSKVTKSLTDATVTAQDSRNTAKNNATTAENNAASQNTKPRVAAAIQKLKDVVDKSQTDVKEALTLDIENATKDLNIEVDVADATDDATQTMQKTTPVSHETDVETARTAVEDELKNSGATASSIAQATKKLADVTSTAQGDRTDAKTAANTAVNNAASQKAKPEVKAAIQKLKDVVAKSDTDVKDALTDDVKKATEDLKLAVVVADAKDLQDATDKATQTLQKTTPVSHETDVETARTAVENELKNKNATPADITKVTKKLADVTDIAQDDRTDAKTSAVAALTNADGQKAKPEIGTAIQTLNDIVAKADTDVADALTDDVEDATKDLNDKVAAANAKDLQDAKDNATQTLQKTTPVSHETEVETARTAVEAELKNKNATPGDIAKVTKKLTDVTGIAQGDRTDAKTAAATALTNADSQKAKPEVTTAIQKLKDVVAKADTDVADALTRDVEIATQDLKDKVAAADAKDLQDATDNATQTLQKTTPVSHETDVEKARTAVEIELKNKNATPADIAKVTKNLADATGTAQGERTDAKTAAATVLNNADSQKAKPEVATAIQKLKDVVAKADTDVADALTGDVEIATQDLKDKVAAADAKDLKDATDNATQTLQKTTPVSHETDVETARTAVENELKNKNATPADIAKVTKNLADVTASEQDNRKAATADAAKTIANANGQDTKPEVGTAIQKLKDVVAKAATDAADALTGDVEDATQDLKDKVAAADARDLQDAKNSANQALQATSPVSHEADVDKARTAVETELKSNSATASSITQATKTLTDASATAQDARTDAKTDAATALTNAASQNSKPDVAAAIEKLKEVVAKSDTDVADALTADVENATNELVAKVATAVNKDLQDAKDAADQAAHAGLPSSNGNDVSDAQEDGTTGLSGNTADDAQSSLDDGKPAANATDGKELPNTDDDVNQDSQSVKQTNQNSQASKQTSQGSGKTLSKASSQARMATTAVKYNASRHGQLPQTGDTDSPKVTVAGLVFAGLLGLAWIGKQRKRN